jgi:hypothetical protein
MGTVPWYTVKLNVPPHPSKPRRCGWVLEADGQTPREAAQVAALQMLMILAQTLADELVDGPAASIPLVAPEEAQWSQALGTTLVRGHGEHAESSSPA